MAARFLIIGSSGLIGKRLRMVLGAALTTATYRTRPFPGGVHFDATASRVADVFERNARYTHAFVLQGIASMDACARDPAGTARTNVEALCSVIDQLVKAHIVPVFASSDAVFDGSRGLWREEDRINPVLTYGAQKAAVENHLRASGVPHVIVRLAKVVTSDPGEPGVVKEWMDQLEAGARIACAHDQRFSPVDADDVAATLAGLAERGCTGLFHVGGPAAVTRLEFLEMLVEEVRRYRHITPDIVRCSLRDLPFAQARPLDTSMCSDKVVRALGRTFRDMRDLCRDAAQRRYGTATRARGAR